EPPAEDGVLDRGGAGFAQQRGDVAPAAQRRAGQREAGERVLGGVVVRRGLVRGALGEDQRGLGGEGGAEERERLLVGASFERGDEDAAVVRRPHRLGVAAGQVDGAAV